MALVFYSMFVINHVGLFGLAQVVLSTVGRKARRRRPGPRSSPACPAGRISAS